MGSYSYPNQNAYPTPQDVFHQQYESVRRDEVVGVLLALFLGCFGIHHFYLGRVGLGILYCCFCWTGIPAILGVIECFFMPGRVRMYNAVQAAGLAAALGIGIPGYVGYPGWTAPGYAPAPSPVYVSVHTGQAVQPQSPETALAVESTLLACGNCGKANPAGARFCSGCGTQLV
jgi:TM2 domain-containing membrane protein YozV